MNMGKAPRVAILGICLLSLTFGISIWSSDALAEEFESGSFGDGSGHNNYDLDCGTNGIITGAMGRFGSYLDQFAVICRTVNPSTGTLGEEFTRGPVGGMGGGRDEIWRCRENQVVASISVSHGTFKIFQPGPFVHAMSFGCAQWVPENRQIIEGLEPSLPLNPLLCSDGSCRVSSFQCPGFRVGKALRGKSGIYIDRIQMACDDWNQ